MSNPPDQASPTKTSSEELSALLKSSAKRRRGSVWLWRIVVVLALVAGAGLYLFVTGGETTYSYTTTAVKKGDVTVLVTATGSLEPTVQIDVSSEQSGTVREVMVDYNSQVKKGEVIARLDTTSLEASLKSAKASLLAYKAAVAKAEADMKSAKASLDRLTSLVSNRVSTQQDLDAAQYNYEAAVATRDSAKANVLLGEAALDTARTNLSKATIISPTDGIVLSRDVDPGATVAASLEAPTLFTIAGDLKKMQLEVAIDEADVGEVAVGQKATFTVDAFPGQRFPAEITSVRYASTTENDVVTYTGILSVDNAAMKLRQGMTATADIVVDQVKDALVVPNAALRYTPAAVAAQASQSKGGSMFGMFRPPRMGPITAPEPTGDQRTVWLLKNGQPNAVNITIGPTDGQNTVVAKGEIAEGDTIITDDTAGGR
ncbi:efflux RND transporter periplasmic adaptor subunit [Rhizobium halophytocola]|uniref:HlyD family secretion protein n=1 Tax=Rhizobium halophytocola TaxID=735519 RepID=A0ABS4DWJ9_9HYPH|nr:efflux RND transporter periplasmic adaptor subunit [Rhizobium halophytocola]MBP1850061.1 HlyD family secretion protein [Rhizobium halophytocola]